MAFMLAAGGELVHWRASLRAVKPGTSVGLLRWFHDQVDRFNMHRGFDIAKVLRVAMDLSQGTLPIFVLCGALKPELTAFAGAGDGSEGNHTATHIIQQISNEQQEAAAKWRRHALSRFLACVCRAWTVPALTVGESSETVHP
jgi:hypothetical protein